MVNKSWFDKNVLKIITFFLVLPTAILLILYWIPLHPIDLISVKILNTDNKVTIGNPVAFKVHYIKYTSKRGTILRQLINERMIVMTPLESNVPMGEAEKIGYIQTGLGEHVGKYHVNYTVVYKYFGFREIVTSCLSDEFELIEARK